MIDLAALFQEATAQHAAQDFPAFPTSATPAAGTQVSHNKHISGISGISDIGEQVNGRAQEEAAQARARAGASERARDVPAEVPEMPEMPEMPEKTAPARTWLSDFPSGKLKKEKEVGNPVRLPAADGLPLWRAGLASLSPVAPPCPGYRVAERSGEPSDEWPRTLANALVFLDRFGPQAEALGWTAVRLFGVHPVAGIVRVDTCGALVLPSAGAVRALTAMEVSFGHLTHREKPSQPQGVPIWEFGR